jgi:hypothetical protein
VTASDVGLPEGDWWDRRLGAGGKGAGAVTGRAEPSLRRKGAWPCRGTAVCAYCREPFITYRPSKPVGNGVEAGRP